MLRIIGEWLSNWEIKRLKKRLTKEKNNDIIEDIEMRIGYLKILSYWDYRSIMKRGK